MLTLVFFFLFQDLWDVCGRAGGQAGAAADGAAVLRGVRGVVRDQAVEQLRGADGGPAAGRRGHLAALLRL